MKKWIGFFVLVIVALVVGGYYEMGSITESTLQKNIGMLNQSSSMSVKLTNYQRGWYTSEAQVDLNFHVPAYASKDDKGQSITMAAEDYKVNMPITIYHGPIIFANAKLRFGLGYAYSRLNIPLPSIKKFAEFLDKTSTMPLLELSLFVDYMNNSQVQLAVPNFKLIEKDARSEFDWYGMTSHAVVSSHLKHLKGGLDLDGARFVKMSTILNLGKVNTDYDLRSTDNGLYLGEASLSMPSLELTDGAKVVFKLKDLKAQSNNDVQDGLFKAQFDASLNQIAVQDKTYGPAVVSVAIKNLDAQVLADINAQANKLQQGSDADRQRAFLTVLPSLPKLFGQGALFEVSKLSLQMPQGAITGSLLISLPKGDAGNPFQLLQKVQGHGNLKIPAEVFKMVITTSVKQKLLAAAAASAATPSTPTVANSSKDAANGQAVSSSTAAQNAAPASATSNTASITKAAPPAVNNQNATPVVADLEQQTQLQAEQKITALLQAGLLSVQDNNYVIDVNLAEGQLTVNGKPFTPAMVDF